MVNQFQSAELQLPGAYAVMIGQFAGQYWHPPVIAQRWLSCELKTWCQRAFNVLPQIPVLIIRHDIAILAGRILAHVLRNPKGQERVTCRNVYQQQ